MKTPEQIADELQATMPLQTTEREMMVAAIEADRAQRERAATRRAVQIVHENYGPDSDTEAYSYAANYIALNDAPDPDARDLIAAALTLGHLDADGVLAMMREAAR